MPRLTVTPSQPPTAVASAGQHRPGAQASAALMGARIAPRRRRGFSLARPVSPKGLTVFTRQLATLVRAGMPILRSLEVLARQEKRPAFRAVIEDLAETIRTGGNLSDGLGAHERVFDRLYVNMVKAGEAGGVLDVVLERIAVFLEKAQKVTGKVKAAMIYPAIIVCVATTIVSVLMVFVVPKFEDIFATLLRGQPLPWLTQALLNVSNFMKDYYVAVGLGVVGVIIFGRVAKRTRVGRRVLDWALIHAPLLGDLFLKAAVARFTRTLGTLLASGVPILQALTITRNTSGNVHVADAIGVVHDRVKEGENVAQPLEATHVFPGMVTSMIQVGEETGALPEMLSRIADTYDDEVDNAVAALTTVIEPIMVVLMAVVVGTIVIALFLPLVSIIQHMS